MGRRPAVLLALFCALASASGGGATAPQPRHRLTNAAQLSLRGTGFQPRERVRVVVYLRVRAVKRVVAGVHGGFVVRFVDLRRDPCAAFSAVAIGNRGSRAAFKRPPGMCPAP